MHGEDFEIHDGVLTGLSSHIRHYADVIEIPDGVTVIPHNAITIAIPNVEPSCYGPFDYSNPYAGEIVFPDSVICIRKMAIVFSDIVSITLGKGLERLEEDSFYYCIKLAHINYRGTVAQWRAIQKHRGWDSGSGNYTVHCSDGDIKKEDA
ncbi:MAG: hypothetical protein IJD22_03825 [Clostridia bacterium]|nr:hypothetical protein [Clostridia bacterium]